MILVLELRFIQLNLLVFICNKYDKCTLLNTTVIRKKHNKHHFVRLVELLVYLTSAKLIVYYIITNSGDTDNTQHLIPSSLVEVPLFRIYD